MEDKSKDVWIYLRYFHTHVQIIQVNLVIFVAMVINTFAAKIKHMLTYAVPFLGPKEVVSSLVGVYML